MDFILWVQLLTETTNTKTVQTTKRPYTKETKGHKRFERGPNLAVKQGTNLDGHNKPRLCGNVYVATRQSNTPGQMLKKL